MMDSEKLQKEVPELVRIERLAVKPGEHSPEIGKIDWGFSIRAFIIGEKGKVFVYRGPGNYKHRFFCGGFFETSCYDYGRKFVVRNDGESDLEMILLTILDKPSSRLSLEQDPTETFPELLEVKRIDLRPKEASLRIEFGGRQGLTHLIVLKGSGNLFPVEKNVACCPVNKERSFRCLEIPGCSKRLMSRDKKPMTAIAMRILVK